MNDEVVAALGLLAAESEAPFTRYQHNDVLVLVARGDSNVHMAEAGFLMWSFQATRDPSFLRDLVAMGTAHGIKEVIISMMKQAGISYGPTAVPVQRDHYAGNPGAAPHPHPGTRSRTPLDVADDMLAAGASILAPDKPDEP